jgi:hypothetical protein
MKRYQIAETDLADAVKSDWYRDGKGTVSAIAEVKGDY